MQGNQISNTSIYSEQIHICLPRQGITIVIPHTLGNTQKKLFVPGGHRSKSAGGNLVNPISILLPQSGAICGSKVEAKRWRESRQSEGQSETIEPKNLIFFREGKKVIFFVQRICGEKLRFVTSTVFLLLFHTLAPQAPHLAHAFVMSLPIYPYLHMHSPQCTYHVLSCFADVFPALHHLRQDTEASLTEAVLLLVCSGDWNKFPSTPPRFPYYNFVCSYVLLFILCSLCRQVKTTPFFAVPAALHQPPLCRGPTPPNLSPSFLTMVFFRS